MPASASAFQQGQLEGLGAGVLGYSLCADSAGQGPGPLDSIPEPSSPEHLQSYLHAPGCNLGGTLLTSAAQGRLSTSWPRMKFPNCPQQVARRCLYMGKGGWWGALLLEHPGWASVTPNIPVSPKTLDRDSIMIPVL